MSMMGGGGVTGEFPSQRASNVENGSIWWLHHGYEYLYHVVKRCKKYTTLLQK